jgi:hypothetical protein
MKVSINFYFVNISSLFSHFFLQHTILLKSVSVVNIRSHLGKQYQKCGTLMCDISQAYSGKSQSTFLLNSTYMIISFCEPLLSHSSTDSAFSVTHGAIFPLHLVILDTIFILLHLGIRPGLMVIFICNHLCHD